MNRGTHSGWTGLMCLIVLVCGGSCAVKTGTYCFDDPLLKQYGDNHFRLWQLELASPPFGEEHFDVALNVGGLFLENEEGPPYSGISQITTNLYDFDLTLRYFPLRRNEAVQPYAGAGFGYFEFVRTSHWPDYEYYDWWNDTYYYESYDSDSDSLASGFYPLVVAGVFIPLHDYQQEKGPDKLGLVAEYRCDFEKKDRWLDFSGHRFTVGCAYTW